MDIAAVKRFYLDKYTNLWYSINRTKGILFIIKLSIYLYRCYGYSDSGFFAIINSELAE